MSLSRVAGSIASVCGTLLLASTMIGCGEKVEIASVWCDRKVEVDGENTEWAGALTDFPDEKISVGVMNDAEFAYVGLFIGDARMQSRVLAQGFTIWFDRGGGTEQRFGIRHPVGLDPKAQMEFMRSMRDGTADMDDLEEALGPAANELEILKSKDDDGARLRINQVAGIRVVARPNNGVLIYELKVPLSETPKHPMAIGTSTGEKIGVGFALAAAQREGIQEDRSSAGGRGGGGGKGGGGGGRGGGGRSGGGGRGGGGSRPSSPEPLEIWAKVQLQASGGGVSG